MQPSTCYQTSFCSETLGGKHWESAMSVNHGMLVAKRLVSGTSPKLVMFTRVRKLFAGTWYKRSPGDNFLNQRTERSRLVAGTVWFVSFIVLIKEHVPLTKHTDVRTTISIENRIRVRHYSQGLNLGPVSYATKPQPAVDPCRIKQPLSQKCSFKKKIKTSWERGWGLSYSRISRYLSISFDYAGAVQPNSASLLKFLISLIGLLFRRNLLTTQLGELCNGWFNQLGLYTFLSLSLFHSQSTVTQSVLLSTLT